jgi:hypothetical protein
MLLTLSGHSSQTGAAPGRVGVCGGRHGGQGLVVHLDEVGGVLGLRARLGHDQRERVADVACAVAREAAVSVARTFGEPSGRLRLSVIVIVPGLRRRSP